VQPCQQLLLAAAATAAGGTLQALERMQLQLWLLRLRHQALSWRLPMVHALGPLLGLQPLLLLVLVLLGHSSMVDEAGC
jgi:hypothetical protein